MVDRPPVPDANGVQCAQCSRSRAGAPPAEALAWVMENDRHGQSWLCPGCARFNVRAIEAKLPAEYW